MNDQLCTEMPMLYIPGLFELLDLLTVEDYYEILCICNMVSAVGLFFYLLKRPLRTGKFYKPAKGDVLVNDHLAFFLTNVIPVLFFIYTGHIFDEFALLSTPAIVFCCVHLFRAVTATKRSRYSSPWPLTCLLYTIGYKIMNAILAARAFVDGEYFSTALTYPKTVLIFAIFAVQVKFDMDIAKFRFHGERGYKIPSSWEFTYISCPSYLCELLIWAVWGSFFALDFGIISIWLWLLPSVYARAEATHRWYWRVFKGQYPKNRTAIIPFLDIGNVVAGVIGSMEYGW